MRWDCDIRMAEALDGHSYNLSRAHEQFLAIFQKDHNIQPPLPVGAAVKTRHGTGIIDQIYERRPMTYTIKMDSDVEADEHTNRRTLLYFDEVEAA